MDKSLKLCVFVYSLMLRVKLTEFRSRDVFC